MTVDFKCIVIGGSAGSFQVVSKLLAGIRADFNLPIVLCLHRLKNCATGFDEALNLRSVLPVREPADKEVLRPGFVYLAPSNYHLMAEIGNTVCLSIDEPCHYSRPSIDVTFESFSFVYREKMIGVILTGANSDGANGMLKCKQRGGYTIVQNPIEASVKTMVQSTLDLFSPNQILSVQEIITFLNGLPNSHKN